MKKETVKYQMMECSCDGVYDIAQRPAGIKGTVVNMLRSAAAAARSIVCDFLWKLCENSVVHSDETDIRIDGKLYWVHVVCTGKITYYAFSKKRGAEATREIDFWPNYYGIVVHDFWKPYFKVTDAEHAMCVAHLLCELTGVFENHTEPDLGERNVQSIAQYPPLNMVLLLSSQYAWRTE